MTVRQTPRGDGRDGRRTLGWALIGIGLIGVVVGAVGYLTWEEPGDEAVLGVEARVSAPVDDGQSPDGTTTITAAPTTTIPVTTTAPTTTSVPASTTTSSTTTSPPLRQEAASDFITILSNAMAMTDVDTLITRLHPEVLERYGVDQCRAYVATQGDPSFELSLVAAGDPFVWTYATDGQSVEIVDTFTATVDQTRGAETARRDIHLAHYEGEIRWFSDCGAPVS